MSARRPGRGVIARPVDAGLGRTGDPAPALGPAIGDAPSLIPPHEGLCLSLLPVGVLRLVALGQWWPPGCRGSPAGSEPAPSISKKKADRGPSRRAESRGDCIRSTS